MSPTLILELRTLILDFGSVETFQSIQEKQPVTFPAATRHKVEPGYIGYACDIMRLQSMNHGNVFVCSAAIGRARSSAAFERA